MGKTYERLFVRRRRKRKKDEGRGPFMAERKQSVSSSDVDNRLNWVKLDEEEVAAAMDRG
jgi:hypothetical protein